MLNENLSLDVQTGIYTYDRKYLYSIQQVNYINFDWELTIWWDGFSAAINLKDNSVGQYLYNQKKGVQQDVQMLKDFGFNLTEI